MKKTRMEREEVIHNEKARGGGESGRGGGEGGGGFVYLEPPQKGSGG